MKKILIYDSKYVGHHSEYINNILTYLTKYHPINIYIYIAIHPKVVDILDLDKKTIPNVEYIILPEKRKISILTRYFYQLSEIKFIVKERGIEQVVLLYLNPLFISLVLMRYNFSVLGIVFYVYNPNYARYSLFKRLSKEFYYGAVSKQRKIKKIFVLNDKKSCEYLNKHFHTDKFCYLPDPIPYYEIEDLPKEIVEIKQTRKIALHFGVMSERKGTLLILDTIATLPDEIVSKTSFFFVGKPYTEAFEVLLRNKIYQLQTQFSNINIHYNPHFVSSGQMESYYKLSDFVLMPYLTKSSSSGVLGYAAKHQKPVIVTSNGLLGEIVEKYDLGISTEINKENLNNSIQNLILNEKQINGSKYVEEHSVDAFVKTLIT